MIDLLKVIPWEHISEVLITFLVTLGGLLLIFKRIWSALFSPDKGLATRWYEDWKIENTRKTDEEIATQKHLRDYLDRAREQSEIQLGLCEENTPTINQTARQVDGLVRASLEKCRACRRLARLYPDNQAEIERSLDDIERVLRATLDE